MQNILFFKNPESLKRDSILWLNVPHDISNKNDFIFALERSIGFSSGGGSWDSLASSLGDDELYGLLKKKGKRLLFLVHEDIPLNNKIEFATYIKVLQSCSRITDADLQQVDFTEKNLDNILDERSDVFGLVVIFSEKDKENIIPLCKSFS